MTCSGKISIMNDSQSIDELELLTLKQVAEVLKVSPRTVQRYITREDNPLPAVSLSPQRMRVRKEDLKQWALSLPDPRREDGN